MLPLDAHDLLGTALFVDVREAYEYDAGHVEGSVHIPIGQIARRWQELSSDKPIVVVCQIGQRSALVTDFLTSKALDAQNLEGGLEAWTAAGLDLTATASRAEVVDGYARDLSGNRLQH